MGHPLRHISHNLIHDLHSLHNCRPTLHKDLSTCSTLQQTTSNLHSTLNHQLSITSPSTQSRAINKLTNRKPLDRKIKEQLAIILKVDKVVEVNQTGTIKTTIVTRGGSMSWPHPMRPLIIRSTEVLFTIFFFLAQYLVYTYSSCDCLILRMSEIIMSYYLTVHDILDT